MKNRIIELLDEGIKKYDNKEYKALEIADYIEAMEVAREMKDYETARTIEDALQIAPLYREVFGLDDKLEMEKYEIFTIGKKDLEKISSRIENQN